MYCTSRSYYSSKFHRDQSLQSTSVPWCVSCKPSELSGYRIWDAWVLLYFIVVSLGCSSIKQTNNDCPWVFESQQSRIKPPYTDRSSCWTTITNTMFIAVKPEFCVAGRLGIDDNFFSPTFFLKKMRLEDSFGSEVWYVHVYNNPG